MGVKKLMLHLPLLAWQFFTGCHSRHPTVDYQSFLRPLQNSAMPIVGTVLSSCQDGRPDLDLRYLYFRVRWLSGKWKSPWGRIQHQAGSQTMKQNSPQGNKEILIGRAISDSRSLWGYSGSNFRKPHCGARFE